MNILRPSPVLASLLVAAAIPLAPGRAADRPAGFSIVATDVTTSEKKAGVQAAMLDPLRAAADQEARYYDPARPPAVMRIRIRKLCYTSAGKAAANSLPFVGLVAGSNCNALAGDVEIVDRASGKSLERFRIEANDDTFSSAGDTALSLGRTGLSFLAFGMLISSAVDVAQGAASHRAASQDMLTRGFIMLSYRKLYGDKAYRSVAVRRKADRDAREAPAQAATVAASSLD